MAELKRTARQDLDPISHGTPNPFAFLLLVIILRDHRVARDRRSQFEPRVCYSAAIITNLIPATS